MKSLFRGLPAALFVTVLYTATLLLAGRDPRPDAAAALALYEARHIATHLVSFALLTASLVWAVPPGHALSPHPLWVCVGVALLIGAGQEAIQWTNRPVLLWGPIALDLVVDVLGGAAGAAAAIRFHSNTKG